MNKGTQSTGQSTGGGNCVITGTERTSVWKLCRGVWKSSRREKKCSWKQLKLQMQIILNEFGWQNEYIGLDFGLGKKTLGVLSVHFKTTECSLSYGVLAPVGKEENEAVYSSASGLVSLQCSLQRNYSWINKSNG